MHGIVSISYAAGDHNLPKQERRLGDEAVTTAVSRISWTYLPSDDNPQGGKSMTGKDQLYVFVGTYTRGNSEGIYVYRFDVATYGWQLQSVTPDRQNPAYVAIHPNGQFLYAVNEVRDFTGARSGAVSAFVIDEKTKSLHRLNQQASMGTGPCHLSVDPEGRCVLVANYGGGSVAMLPINEDGSLQAATSFVQHEGRSVDPKRQEAPHAHNIIFDPQARFALAADLGLDRIVIYKIDRHQWRLVQHTPPWAATGCRAAAFSFSSKRSILLCDKRTQFHDHGLLL